MKSLIDRTLFIVIIIFIFTSFLTVFFGNTAKDFISHDDARERLKKAFLAHDNQKPTSSSLLSSPNNNNNNNAITSSSCSTKSTQIPNGKVGSVCKYEGHCPIGTTCVMSSPDCNDGLGICQSYVGDEVVDNDNTIQKNIENFHSCADRCYEELIIDENYQFLANIQITKRFYTTTTSTSGSNRPDGCVLQYNRIDNKDDPNQGNPDDEEFRNKWLNGISNHHIVRIDPILSNNKSSKDPGINNSNKKLTTSWQVLCYNTCQNDNDCNNNNNDNKKGFVCINNSCQRNRDQSNSYWNSIVVNKNDSSSSSLTTTTTNSSSNKQQPPPIGANDLYIITGATQSYYRGLQNLIGSVQYWIPNARIVVYNLGLNDDSLQQIQTYQNVIDIKWPDGGIPKEYPPHVHVGKQYAWKPIAMNESLYEYKKIFWMDAGNTFVGPIDNMLRILEDTGIYLVKGQDVNMALKSHEATYEYFNYTKSNFLYNWGGPHFSGNTQAYLYPSRYVNNIVKRNALCAIDVNCISPKGSHLSNHRYDQTTLSILAYEPNVQIQHHTEYLAASQQQLNKDLNKPNKMFVWTARQGCNFYVKYINSNKNYYNNS